MSRNTMRRLNVKDRASALFSKLSVETIVAILASLLLAFAVRWPLSGSIGAIPLDPNTPLHALASKQIATGGSIFEISDLAFPTPVPIRIVAFPMLLLALPFQWLGPLQAVNIATTLLVACQGMALWWLAGKIEMGRVGRIVALTAGILAPWTVHVQGLGQQENLAFVAMALAVWGGLGLSWKHWIIALAALIMAGFSSPYQAVPTGMIFLCTLCVTHYKDSRRQTVFQAVSVTVMAAIPVLVYYMGVTDGASAIAGITTSPPEDGAMATAGLVEFIYPRPMWDGSPSELLNPAQRLAGLSQPIPSASLSPGWAWFIAHQSSYLGFFALLGFSGLWRGRNDPRIRGILVGGICCLILSLGPELRLFSESSSPIWMPWKLAAVLPGVGDLTATHRFLSGFAFSAALGLGLLVQSANPRVRRTVATMVGAGLLVETLLIAPVQWPLPAIKHTQQDLNQQLPAGPIMMWPPFTALAPQYFELLTVLLERPVGIYSPAGVTISGEILWTEPVDGTIRVDLVAERSNGPTDQEVVHAFSLDSAGEFSESVEIDLGTVELIAFIDREGDGPTPGEPIGHSEKFRVGLRDVTDIEVAILSTEPEVVELTDQDGHANRRSAPMNRIPADLPTSTGHQSPAEWIMSGGRAGAFTMLMITSDDSSAYSESPIFHSGRSDLIMSEPTCIDENLCWYSLSFRELNSFGRSRQNNTRPSQRGAQRGQTGADRR